MNDNYASLASAVLRGNLYDRIVNNSLETKNVIGFELKSRGLNPDDISSKCLNARQESKNLSNVYRAYDLCDQLSTFSQSPSQHENSLRDSVQDEAKTFCSQIQNSYQKPNYAAEQKAWEKQKLYSPVKPSRYKVINYYRAPSFWERLKTKVSDFFAPARQPAYAYARR